MSEVSIDSATFRRRAHALQRRIGAPDDELASVGSILVVTGDADEANPYMKSSVLQTWLLGYEFPQTAIVLTRDRIVVVTSAKKARYLQGLQAKDVEILGRNKDADHDRQLFEQLLKVATDAGSGIGIFAKDKASGKFISEWNVLFDPVRNNDAFELVDVSLGFAIQCQVKDEDELRTVRTASKASMGVMTKYFAEEMSAIIDDERPITHSKFSDLVEKKIEDGPFFRDLKLGSEFDYTQLEWCYSPIVQSGGHFDLKPSAVSDTNQLHAGVIVSSLGLRYKSYCSNLGRTYLIDPTKRQEDHYAVLLALQKHLLTADVISEGKTCKHVYEAALEFVRASKSPELEAHLLKNVGWGVGIDFRDTSLLLNAKNSHLLKDGMTLNVVVGFQDIPNPDSTKSADKVYSLLLSDTVRVTDAAPIVFTDSAKSRSDVCFYFKQGNDEKKAAKAASTRNGNRDGSAGATSKQSSAVLRSKMRTETKAADEGDGEKKREMRQKELRERLQRLGLERYDESGESLGQEKVVIKKFESYKRESQLPPTVRDLRVQVDVKAQTIVVPINGRPVPLHISTFKTASKTDEGDFVSLRLNFSSPGQGGVRKDGEAQFEDPGAQFVRSMTFRSRDADHMNSVFKKIQDLKRDAQKRESERKEMQDVVKQDKLIEMRSQRPLRLEAVFVRPGPEGKRLAGVLEVHQNGVRYSSRMGNSSASAPAVEVLFSNVKHIFFQPCDNELIVAIHFHLKNPIIVGKRKTFDVQFYREASDMAFDETGNRKRRYRYGDDDEIEQEEEERRRRVSLNKEFKAFGQKISDAARASGAELEVDVPFRELGFTGVPFRADVFCQPTTDCLVQLVEPPFLVVTLAEVEVVHFERVSFGLKQFDMVFVYKDFTRPVTHINSVPMSQLDSVKDWFNETDIAYYEGPVNLNWNSIMKTVTTDPHDFFAAGGWSFLSTEDSDEEARSESEAESEFNPSESEPEDEDESEEEFSDEDGDDYDDEEDDESGEDWDDLDARAEEEDSKRKR